MKIGYAPDKTAIMDPFHKISQDERDQLAKRNIQVVNSYTYLGVEIHNNEKDTLDNLFSTKPFSIP
jgi:hypothetical protein